MDLCDTVNWKDQRCVVCGEVGTYHESQALLVNINYKENICKKQGTIDISIPDIAFTFPYKIK